MARPSNPRKPEKLLSLSVPPLDKADLAGQTVPMYVQPKGIDRYNTSNRVDTESAVRMRNLMFDDGNLVSRLGTDLMGGEAASPVMQVVDLVRKGRKKVTLRFCTRHLEIFEFGMGTWRSFPVPLTGTERDFFAYTGWANKLLFSNGVDGLWEFDFTTMEAKIVPGAPSAKHLTTFGLRVVASSTVEGAEDYPLRVRWSANRDYTRWDEPTEDNPLTADLAGGHEDLYGAPEGVLDEAIGVYPYSDEQAWLVRSRSIWQMSVSGNALAPFRFSRILAGTGTPYRNTIVSAPAGILFGSRDNIHLLSNEGHQLIGLPIMDEVADEVDNFNEGYAAYDIGRQEYRIAVDQFVWRYRLIEKGWTLDEYPFPIRSLSRQIQGVAGIPIDSLPATIDELSALFPPGAINDLVYDRSFDDAMMFVPRSTVLTLRETDDPRDSLLTGEETDSEIVIETGVVNLDKLKAVEFHGLHMEYESEMDQHLIFEYSTEDGSVWLPLSVKDVEATLGSEILFVKQERVSRKLRLRLRSATLGKLRLLGIAPVLVMVERSMASRKPKPATIEILPATLSLTVGGTQQLSVRVLDANGQQITNLSVTLLSSDSNIATVSRTGIVRALAEGSFAIVATVRNIQTSVSGTVTAAAQAPVASVTLTPSIAQGVAGSTQQFTATLRDASGNILTGRVITWSSSTPGFATVNSAGLVSLSAAGVTVISATSEGVTGGSTLTVTASSATVVTVQVTPATFSGEPGDSIQLVASPKDGGGNVLVGKVITWGTSAPSVATVNATGLVTMVGVGGVTITATCETIPGTSTGTVTAAVEPVATVTVTPSSFSKAPGQTQALTVVTKDANGNVLVGRTITYLSSNTAIATVDGSGVVTAVATGTATITATSEGKSGTSIATVTVVPVASVTVSPNVFSLNVGNTVQLTATARDALNNILTGRPVTWGSSDVTRATVSNTGLVTAVAVGSVTITASVETKLGTSAGTIGVGVYSPLNAPASTTYVPRPNPAGAPAQLPQRFVTTAEPVSFASTVSLTDQGGISQNTAKLQQYIDEAAARAGNSKINVANNLQFNKPIIRKHAFAGATTLIQWANNPVLDIDQRFTPSDAVNAPILFAPGGGDSALQFDRSANRTIIRGFKVKAQPGVTIYDLIFVSPREGGGLDFDDDINNIPEDIWINQCLLEGNDSGNGVDTGNVRNGIALNARRGAITNSYIHQIGSTGTESHGVIFYNTDGPVKVVNNYIEATSIGLLIGGAAPNYGRTVGRPNDVEIRRNHFTRRLTWARTGGSWDGVNGRGIKNQLESKNSIRTLIEGNIFENNWADGQSGMMIVIKSAEGSTTFQAPLEGTEDVTIRYNIVRNSTRCWNFAALPDEPDAIIAKRAVLYSNLAYDIGAFVNQTDGLAWLITQQFDDLWIDHNTTILNTVPNQTFQLAYPSVAKAAGFRFANNITEFPYVWSDGVTSQLGIENWARLPYMWNWNVTVMPDNSLWALHPQLQNQYLTNRSGIGFVDLAGDNYLLDAGSAYKGDGEGGSDPGADIASVLTATSGV